MRRAEILTALGFLAFAIAVMVQGRSVGSGWSGGQPQPGMLRFFLGLLLEVYSAAVLGQALRSDPSVHHFFEYRTGIMSVLKVALTGIAMLVLTYVVGFYTATLVYVLVYSRFVGKHHWPVAIALSLAISFGSFYLFERVLAILLPRGLYTIIPFFG